MIIRTNGAWNSPFKDEMAGTFRDEETFALKQVKNRTALTELKVICAEAYAELGDLERALVHLRGVSHERHSLDRNLFAIAGCLRNSGFLKEAKDCSESAFRISRRRFREADYQYGAIGELCRTFALAAISTEDKGKARSIKRSARVLELLFPDGDMPADVREKRLRLAYDVEGALVASGAIYHGGFHRHGIRSLEAVSKIIERVLITADPGTPNAWIQLGACAVLLFHQMNEKEKAERFGLIVGHACSRLLLSDFGLGECGLGTKDNRWETDEYEGEYDDERDGELFDPLEIHDQIRILREQGLIGTATDVKVLKSSAIEHILKMLDSLEKDEDIESSALSLFALSVEYEISSGMTGYERLIWGEEFEKRLSDLEEYASFLESGEAGGIHPAELSELGLSVISSYYCLDGGERRDRVVQVASRLADISIENLTDLDSFLTVSQFASIVDDALLDAKEGSGPNINHTMQLSDKAKEIFRKNLILGRYLEEKPELLGGGQDYSLDLDTNTYLVERLATMGLYEEARALAAFTASDDRALKLENMGNGTHLEAVWVGYLSGVYASLELPLVMGKGVESLPRNSETWLKYRG